MDSESLSKRRFNPGLRPHLGGFGEGRDRKIIQR